MIRPLLLMLLLIASPAWADPIETLVLSGTADLRAGFMFTLHITTAEFTGRIDNDGHAAFLYQGQVFCSSNGNSCTPGGLTGGFPGVGYEDGPGLVVIDRSQTQSNPCPLPSLPSETCEHAPATIHSRLQFRDATPPYLVADFVYTGAGIAYWFGTSPNSGFHADFGSSVTQTPEPATWLLLLTGLIMALSVGRRRAPTSDPQDQ